MTMTKTSKTIFMHGHNDYGDNGDEKQDNNNNDNDDDDIHSNLK